MMKDNLVLISDHLLPLSISEKTMSPMNTSNQKSGNSTIIQD